jgi:hypothetical protein
MDLKEMGIWGADENSTGSEQAQVLGSCQHDIESSGSIKVEDFPEHLNDYPFLKKDSTALS